MKPDRVLDWAERRTFFVMVAGFAVGDGIGQLIQGKWYGWLLLVPGLILTAIRPLGTGLRRNFLIRQARQALKEDRCEEGSC